MVARLKTNGENKQNGGALFKGSLREGAVAERLRESACRIKIRANSNVARAPSTTIARPPKLDKLVSGNLAVVPLPPGGRLV